MSDFFLSNYETSWSEKLLFFISPVYSDRHFAESLQAKNWQGRAVHLILSGLERTVIFGAMIALVEAALVSLWRLLQSGGLINDLDDTLLSPMEDRQPLSKADVQVEDVEQAIVEEALVETDEQREKRRKGTATILTTHGFEREAQDHPSKDGYKGEVQGTAALRFATAKATRVVPEAISPASLKEQRELNLEQYLRIKLKRFAHALGLEGHLTLPSGKEFNLEGFCEAFTVPMIASSCRQFSRTNTFFNKDDWEWIVKSFNQTTSSDSTEPDDIQVFATLIQDPDFVGPVSLGTGHHWHSTGTIFFGNYLIFCNRGHGSNGEPGIHVYYLPDRSIITEGVIWEMTKRQDVFGGDVFGLHRIVNELGGQLVHYEKMSDQIVGNCTYVSMMIALYTFMVMRQLMNFDQESHLYTDSTVWQQAFETLKPHFDIWVAFDRAIVFKDTFNEIKEWLDKDSAFSKYPLQPLYAELLQIWYNRQKSAHPGRPVSAAAQQVLDAFDVK